MVVMMTVAASDGLGEILNVRNLTAGGGAAEIRGELSQLAGEISVPVGGRRLRRGLQFARDLLRYLLILSRIGLLQLLQSTQNLRERRELISVLRAARGGGAGG